MATIKSLYLYSLVSSLGVPVQYVRRGRTVLAVTVSLLIMALLVLTLGFLAATRTDNVHVAGFYSGIAVSPVNQSTTFPVSTQCSCNSKTCFCVCFS